MMYTVSVALHLKYELEYQIHRNYCAGLCDMPFRILNNTSVIYNNFYHLRAIFENRERKLDFLKLHQIGDTNRLHYVENNTRD